MASLNFSGSGYFKVDSQDEEYLGNLYLNQDEGGILLEVEIKHDGPPISYLTLPLEAEYISGELFNGFKLTLLNCTRTGMTTHYGRGTTFTYIAEFMFEGLKILDTSDDLFEIVEFVVSDLMLWGNKSCYEINKNDYSIRGKLDSNETLIIETEEYIVKYSVRGRMLPVNEKALLVQEIKLIQKPIITIQSKQSKKFDFFLERYNMVKRFIEIGIKKEVNLAEIISYPTKDILRENNYTYEIPVKVKSSLINIKDTKTNYSELRLYLFSLDDVKNYCDFETYVENSKKLEPIIDLYLDIIYSKSITLTRAFLNIVQALETFHSRFIYNGNLQGFKKRIENVILKDTSLDFKEEYKNFLLANSRSFVTLGSRIADLLLAEFNLHFYTGNIPYIDFPNIIVNTRNYYTHYDEKLRDKIIDEEDLGAYVNILVKILEYYLLEKMGFSDVNYRSDKYYESIYDIRTYFDIKNSINN